MNNSKISNTVEKRNRLKKVKITELETGKEFIFSGKVKLEQVAPVEKWAKPIVINDIYNFNEDMANSNSQSFYLHFLMD